MNDHVDSNLLTEFVNCSGTTFIFIKLIKLLQNVLDGGQIVSCTIDIN